MKKRIMVFLMAAVLMLTLALPGAAAPMEGSCVIDRAGLLTQEEFEALEQKAESLGRKWDCGVYLAVVEDYHSYGNSVQKAAIAIYEENDWGLSKERNGFMLLLSMKERDYWLMSHGTAGNYALNPGGRTRMEREFLPHFADDHWYDGFSAYLAASDSFLAAADDGQPVAGGQTGEDSGEKDGNVLIYYGIALGVSALIALLVCMGFKRQMNTAVAQADADAYVEKDGVTITKRSDYYTHTTTVRHKIEQNNSSGGSSGHSSGGGYSGSGGKF